MRAPLFVPLVENGVVAPEDPIVQMTVERYLRFFSTGRDRHPDPRVHAYPILRDAIAAFLGTASR